MSAVPGLVFNGKEFMHDGHPVEQMSGMRKLEISTLLGMAENPRLKAMVIDEGDQLDDAAVRRLAEIALERKYVVFMTAIRAGDPDDPNQKIIPIREGKLLEHKPHMMMKQPITVQIDDVAQAKPAFDL